MNNKKIGNCFEQELCDRLYACGFWVHLLNANKSGQPADVIAVKNREAYLIDCKVCSNNKFPFDRIEENQDLSMELWKDSCNGVGWFALKIDDFDNQIYMISHYTMIAYRNRQKSLSDKEIRELGIPFDKWVKKCK